MIVAEILRARTELNLPTTIKSWLENRAAEDASTLTAVVTRLVKAEMKREQQGVSS